VPMSVGVAGMRIHALLIGFRAVRAVGFVAPCLGKCAQPWAASVAGILSVWPRVCPRMWQRWRVWLGGGRRLVGRCARAWTVRPAAAGVCGVVRRAGAAWVVVAQKGGLNGSLSGCV
jgi:hypothetical protein